MYLLVKWKIKNYAISTFLCGLLMLLWLENCFVCVSVCVYACVVQRLPVILGWYAGRLGTWLPACLPASQVFGLLFQQSYH